MQQREMMHLARFAGFEDQADAGAGARTDQMMVQTRHSQERRDRGFVRFDSAVGQNQNAHAVSDGFISGGKDFRQRVFEALCAIRNVEQDGNRGGLDAGP